MLLLLDNEAQPGTGNPLQSAPYLPSPSGSLVTGLKDSGSTIKMISQRLPDVSLRHFQQDLRGPLQSQPADSEDRHHGSSGQMLSVRKMNTPQKQASFPLQQVLLQTSSHALLQFLHQRIFPEIALRIWKVRFRLPLLQ